MQTRDFFKVFFPEIIVNKQKIAILMNIFYKHKKKKTRTKPFNYYAIYYTIIRWRTIITKAIVRELI